MTVHSMLISTCHHTHHHKPQAAEGEGCLQPHRAPRNSSVLSPGSEGNSHPWRRTWPLRCGQALPLYGIHTLVTNFPRQAGSVHLCPDTSNLVVQHLVQPSLKSIGCIRHWPVQWLDTNRKDKVSNLTPALSDTSYATPARTHCRSY